MWFLIVAIQIWHALLDIRDGVAKVLRKPWLPIAAVGLLVWRLWR